MEAVKSFNDELSGIYETKPPISRAKMTVLTKKAIKGIKYYKHIVQSIEKFIQKCRPEYKVPGLYVIDSVVRQSRHQFGADKDVFMPRLCKNIIQTFTHIYQCPADQKSRILRVLNLWQKNSVFPIETVQQLMIMGGAPAQNNTAQGSDQNAGQHNVQDLTSVLVDLLANPDTKRVEDLAKILSTSQRQQIEQLLKKNPDTDEPKPHEPQSAYGRGGVLDFDYEGDEKTPEHQMDTGMHHHHHQQQQPPPPLPPHLQQFDNSAPAPSSLQQQSGAFANKLPPSMSLRHLEEEQKNFDQQLQQIAGNEGQMDFGGEMGMMNSSNSEHRKRSRSRSRSRDKRHRRHRSRSREHRSRHRSRSRDRSSRHRSRRSRSREERRRPERKGLPPLKTGYISVCSKTVWIGNISGKVSQTELQEIVESYGTIENINMIPPRGCAYIVMESRQDASFALRKLKHQRLGGKSLKCDWAASKDMPDEQKSTWVKEHGVNYVPTPNSIDKLEGLRTWGFIDPDSVPEHLRAAIDGGAQQQQGAPPPVPPASSIATPPPKFPFINQQLLSSVANSVMTLNAAAAAAGANQQRNFIQLNNQPPPHPHQLLVRSFAPTVPQPVAAVSTAAITSTGAEPMDLDGGSPERELTLNRGEQQQHQLPPPMDHHHHQQQQQQQQEMNNQSMVPPQHQMQQQQPPVSGAQFGPISIAQRFPGPHMPVQIRMMPAMAGQPGVMQHRMGLMPLRMSIPMQMRPGFHAVAAQRMPAGHGPPGHPMLTNHMPPHLHQAAGFPIRMQAMRPPMHPQERMPQAPEHVHGPQPVQGLGPRGPVPPPQMAEQNNSIMPPQVPPSAARISEEPERPSTAENAESHEGSPFVRQQQQPPQPPNHPPHQEGSNTTEQNHQRGMANGGAAAPTTRVSRFSDITAEDPGIPPTIEDMKMYGRRPPPPSNDFPPHDRPLPFGGRRGGDNRDDFDRRNRDWDSRGGRDNEGGRGRRDMRGEPPWRQHGGNDRGGYQRGGGNDDYRGYRGGPPPPEDRPYHGGFNRGFGGGRDEMMSRGGGGGRGGWSGRQRSPMSRRTPPRMRGASPGGRGGRSPSGGRRTRSPPRSDRARSPSMIYGGRGGGGGDRDHRRGGRDERRASRTSENNDEDHHRRRRHSPRSRDEDEESRKRRLWLENNNNNSEQGKADTTGGNNKEEGEVVDNQPEVQQGDAAAAEGKKVDEMEATTDGGSGDMMMTSSNQATDVTTDAGGSDEEGQIVEEKIQTMTMERREEESSDNQQQQVVEVDEIVSSKPDVHIDAAVVTDGGGDGATATAQLDSTIEEGEVPDDDDEVAGYEAA